MSKPKPGSHSSPITPSRSANSRRMRAGSRNGAPVPTSMRSTLPSVRNSATCNSRAPSPRRSSSAPSSCGELLDGAEHVALERDRLGEAPLGHAGRHRQARRDRLVLAARAPDRGGARTPRRSARRAARAGGRCTSAMRLRPTCASASTVSGAMPQRGERQRQQSASPASRPAARLQPRIADSAPPPRRSRPCRRPRRAPASPARPAARTRSRAQRRLAAEQMRAAGDVEHQPVRRIEPDQRRVAVAPVGDRFEQRAVGVRDRHRAPRCADTSRAHRRAPCRACSPSARRRVVHGGRAATRLSPARRRRAARQPARASGCAIRSVASRRSHTER